MKRFIACWPLLAPLTVTAADPVVKLAGLQIVFDDGAEAFDGFQTYNSEKGYSITLIIDGGGKDIVGFDGDEAIIKIGGAVAKSQFFGSDSGISKDHRALRAEFSAKKSPKISDNGTIAITGELPIVTATGKEEVRSEAFAITKDTQVKFPADKEGMPTLKVKSSGKPKWGDDPFEVSLTTNTKVENFAGVLFYDKAGKLLETDRTSSSWMGMGSKGSGEITYSFKTTPTDVVLGLEVWTGREEILVKVDLNASLVMPK